MLTKMTEVIEKPAKAEEPDISVDPRLAEVVEIIVEQFGGDVAAYLASIRPKTGQQEKRRTSSKELAHKLAKDS